MWQSQMDWQTAKDRATVIHNIRAFFIQRNVVEVETPCLSKFSVTDPFLDAFETHDFPIEDKSKLYLQTSPEYAMKRLLCSGYQSIFQLCKSFRFEASGSHHNHEFTMLEWYRLGFDMFDLIDEVDSLLNHILGTAQAERISYKSLFESHVGVDPLNADLVTLKHILLRHGIEGDWINKESDKDILLQVILSEIIEPKIGKEKPIFIYHYPASQSSLAQLNKQKAEVADRFECYFKGIELANGFKELQDAKQQKARFDKDNEKRTSNGIETVAIDNRFISALESGLPDCSGVALGVDRLVMLALGKSTIKDVISFNSINA